MSDIQPLADRQRLEDEIRSAQGAADLANANAGRAKARQVLLIRERIEAYSDSARGKEGAAERVEEIEEELAELAVTVERETAASEGALRGRRMAEEEHARLLRDHLPLFAEEAEEFTEQARAAMSELSGPYKAAAAAWAAAQANWAPLARAIREELVEAREAAGTFSAGAGDAEASRPPAFPLPAPGSVFERVEEGSLAARPPALRRETQPEEVSTQP